MKRIIPMFAIALMTTMESIASLLLNWVVTWNSWITWMIVKEKIARNSGMSMEDLRLAILLKMAIQWLYELLWIADLRVWSIIMKVSRIPSRYMKIYHQHQNLHMKWLALIWIWLLWYQISIYIWMWATLEYWLESWDTLKPLMELKSQAKLNPRLP